MPIRAVRRSRPEAMPIADVSAIEAYDPGRINSLVTITAFFRRADVAGSP